MSTLEPAHFVARLLALTGRIHRRASTSVRRTVAPGYADRGTIASPSPLKYTGLRVVAAIVVHARTSVARRPGAHPHRRKTQRFEWSREPDIHMDECAWIDGGCTRRNPSATGNPYRKRHRARRSADAHRRKSQWRASFRRPDIHTGMRRRLARNLASRRDTDGASRGFIGRAAASSRAARRSRAQIHHWVTRCVESREQAKTRTETRMLRTTRRRTPLECTALRLGPEPDADVPGHVWGGHALATVG